MSIRGTARVNANAPITPSMENVASKNPEIKDFTRVSHSGEMTRSVQKGAGILQDKRRTRTPLPDARPVVTEGDGIFFLKKYG